MTTTVTLKSPEDVISLVPHILGHHPTESLVLVVPGSKRMVARIDMPTTEVGRLGVVNALAPMYADVLPILAVTYTLDDEAADAVVALIRQHADVLTHIRVHAETYRADDGPEQPLVDSLRVEAQMVLHGSNPATSRADFDLPTKISESLARAVSSRNPVAEQSEEEAWVLGRLTDPQHGHERFTDDELARIIVACSLFGHRFRDVIHTTFDRSVEQRDQWRDAAERVGDGWTEVLVTYAMASWLAGDGVQAWVGVNAVSASSSDRDDMLALLIGETLRMGIDPATFAVMTLNELNGTENGVES